MITTLARSDRIPSSIRSVLRLAISRPRTSDPKINDRQDFQKTNNNIPMKKYKINDGDASKNQGNYKHLRNY